MQAPTTRISTEHHMYSKKYYETRVKPDVELEISRTKDLKPKQKIAIINKHLKNKYKNESEEVKAEIRAAIEKEKKEKEDEKGALEAVTSGKGEMNAQQYMMYVSFYRR